ncbi:MAG: sulfatase [Akkermansiaceae bacterium]|nr:sulfatase [Akkermansiaceae bacterium]
MNRTSGLLLALISLLLTPAADARPNVLLIAIDDLNDWVGCLGGHPDARTPHIDRLAKRGVLFTNAHCQAPICNPSRTSLMYGLRPSTSGVYENSPRPWTVPALKDRVTLPRHFAANGYRTLTTGKIYYGSGLPPGDFDVVGPRPGQRLKIDKRLVPSTGDGASGLWDFGAQDYDEKLFQDHADATWAIERIREKNPDPFFLAIGFYRPHVPFYSPARVFKQIPESEIDLPRVKDDDWSDIPAIARDLCRAPAAPDHSWFVESGRWKEAVQSYLACIRWTDEQVGRLLDALDASPHAADTIVVLYSDHGFFLGEKQRWAKQSLWERATKVPFIIAGPPVLRSRDGEEWRVSKGTPCARPAELLGIYPTLIDLCGLPVRDDLDGTSLVPLLKDPGAAWDQPALTTHGRNNHAVRTATHRYIRYHDGSEELYDLVADPDEWTNLAGGDEHAALKARLARHFPKTNAAPAEGSARKGRKNRKNAPKPKAQ